MAGVLLYCLSAKYHALFSSIFGFHFIYELMLTEALKRRRRTFKLSRHLQKLPEKVSKECTEFINIQTLNHQ